MISLDPNSFDWSIINDPAFRTNLGIRNADDRDDALQHACVKLLQRSKPVTDPLLRKTILNRHKDLVKAEKRRRNRERNRVDPRVKPATHRRRSSQADPAAFEARDEYEKPSGNLERRERRRAIKRAVRAAQLSKDHRCALWAWMRDRVGDFAGRRRVPQVTVRVWAKRARDALLPHLKREGLGPD